MMLSGRTLREHIQLLVPLFGLITAVWVLRWSLFQIGVPLSIVRLISVTAAVPVCILLATLLIHSKKFGGYLNAIVCAVLLVIWSQFLIVLAVFFAVMTGFENVYTLPEFSVPGADPLHFRHIRGQLTFAIGSESLFGSLIACLFLFMLRRLTPRDRRVKDQGDSGGSVTGTR